MNSNAAFIVFYVVACFSFRHVQQTVTAGDETEEYWRQANKDELSEILDIPIRKTKAKNVIFTMGDGMSISTLTAARILKGQLKGVNGESYRLAMEKYLPHSALSKTYSFDYQVSDSAATAFAMMSGVKTKSLTFGYAAENVQFNFCNDNQPVRTILDAAHEAGMKVGIVTTTRVTHASPAALYAKVASRVWEAYLPNSEQDAGCTDIAKQLINRFEDIDLVLGGGLSAFLPQNDTGSWRQDDLNLLEEFASKYPNSAILKTKEDMINSANTLSKILGLFGESDIEYVVDKKNTSRQPSLREMTDFALTWLQAKADEDRTGYFLFIESGRIDHVCNFQWNI